MKYEVLSMKYESFIVANRETAEELLPAIQRQKKRAHSNDPRVVEQRERMKKAYHTYQEHTDEGNRQELEEAKDRLERAYELVAEEKLASRIHEVKEAQKRKHSKSWQLINEISGRRTSRKGQLKGTSQLERVKNWYEHFQRLLGAPPKIDNEDEDIPPILNDLNIKIGPFDIEEYAKTKKSITEEKSCGKDGITPEVMKRCNIDGIILDFCNAALTEREKPAQRSILNRVPIPKSGDLSIGGKYRGISLSSIVAKIYNRMILNRIRPEIDRRE